MSKKKGSGGGLKNIFRQYPKTVHGHPEGQPCTDACKPKTESKPKGK
jgi:hypothetical protein